MITQSWRRIAIALGALSLATALGVLLLLNADQEAAAVDVGVVAFKNGNYAAAAAQLAPWAEKGNKTARLTLGMMYAFGNGVERDRDRAVTLLRDSVDGSVGDFYSWIAQSFEKGDGVARDEAEARAWFELASLAAGQEVAD